MDVMAADQFPSCCGSHTRIRAHFSAVGDDPQDMIGGSQKRGFLNTLSVQSLAMLRHFHKSATRLQLQTDGVERENRQSRFPLVKSKVYFPHLPRNIQRLNKSSSRKMDQVQIQGSAGPHLRLFVSL